MRFFLKVTGEETFDKISSILAIAIYEELLSNNSVVKIPPLPITNIFFPLVSVFYVFVELFFPITGGSEYKKHFRWP
jgi:hypothetical protein